MHYDVSPYQRNACDDISVQDYVYDNGNDLYVAKYCCNSVTIFSNFSSIYSSFSINDKMALFTLFDWLTVKTIPLLVLVFLVATWWVQSHKNLPPGPWGFPLVGCFPQLVWGLYRGEQLHELATRLGYKHGKLYSMEVFGQVFIVMNDFSIMREGNINPLLSNKGHNSELEIMLFGQHRKFKRYYKLLIRLDLVVIDLDKAIEILSKLKNNL